jgi:hypothetical protein
MAVTVAIKQKIRSLAVNTFLIATLRTLYRNTTLDGGRASHTYNTKLRVRSMDLQPHRTPYK